MPTDPRPSGGVPRLMALTSGRLQPDAAREGSRELDGWLGRLESLEIALQIREKQLSDADLHRLTADIRRRFGGVLLVNSRPDVARATGAEGVHLTSTSIPCARVRAAFPELLLGVSTHHLSEAALHSRAGADYVFLSPIFPTPSKPDHPAPLGLQALRDAAALGLRILALGGIDASNAGAALRAGAHGVAGIRCFADDPEGVAGAAGLR